MMQIDKIYIQTRFWKLYARFISYTLFEGRPLTTKGQWINPIVFTNYHLAKKFPKTKNADSPIYIIGTGRSGTTILGIIMSMHKDVAFLNEPKALWYFINREEDLIGSYTMGKANYHMDYTHATEKQKQDIQKIYSAYLFATFSKRVVDKYPELVFRIPYIQSLFPNAKFLFLVRNGWDTCASINKWSQRLATSNSNETQDWWGRNNRKWHLLVDQVLKKDDYFSNVIPVIKEITEHTDMAALEWIATMRQGLRVLKNHSGTVLRINYEDLVSHPDTELKRIQEFCKLQNDDVFFSYGINILAPTKDKKPFKLHTTIEPLFLETMHSLGY